MIVRPAAPTDADAIWSILEPAIRAGQVFALPRDMSRTDALAHWSAPEHEVFVAEDEGQVAGTYFLTANHLGGGAHVANCGYATVPSAFGRGIARTMCAHSVGRARARNFRAMQFNFVVSSNTRAVKLWQSFGFEIVGRLPGAFAHPQLGLVDVYVMYLRLAP